MSEGGVLHTPVQLQRLAPAAAAAADAVRGGGNRGPSSLGAGPLPLFLLSLLLLPLSLQRFCALGFSAAGLVNDASRTMAVSMCGNLTWSLSVHGSLSAM